MKKILIFFVLILSLQTNCANIDDASLKENLFAAQALTFAELFSKPISKKEYNQHKISYLNSKDFQQEVFKYNNFEKDICNAILQGNCAGVEAIFQKYKDQITMTMLDTALGCANDPAANKNPYILQLIKNKINHLNQLELNEKDKLLTASPTPIKKKKKNKKVKVQLSAPNPNVEEVMNDMLNEIEYNNTPLMIKYNEIIKKLDRAQFLIKEVSKEFEALLKEIHDFETNSGRYPSIAKYRNTKKKCITALNILNEDEILYLVDYGPYDTKMEIILAISFFQMKLKDFNKIFKDRFNT